MFAQPKKPRLAVEHELARQLRYLGAPIRRIARYLGVSQSTVSVWVRDIELLPQHRAANAKRAGAVRGDLWSERWRSKRRDYQLDGRRRARKGELLHAQGCMLYWAEGSKSRNTAQLSNSHPDMQRMFLRFLRECFSIEDGLIRISLNVYTSESRMIDEIEAHWLGFLELPSSCARKHTLNHFPTSSSGLKKDKLPNGTCTLTVGKSTWLVQHIYGAIQEYGGFEEPTWLDGLY